MRSGVMGELDRAVGPIKARARGGTGGHLLVGTATGQLSGQDCLTGWVQVRADPASALLVHAPVPAADRRAARLPVWAVAAGRDRGGASAVYSRWLTTLPAQLRGRLVLTDPTIDLDATDIEVYGHAKGRVGWKQVVDGGLG